MVKEKESEKIPGITDMVEFLTAHMELNEIVNGLKEDIKKASKLNLNDLSAIDDYLSEKKKRRTTQDKIDYLYEMDPNSFDEELMKLGVRTMNDVDSVIDAFRKMDDIATNFATSLRESGVLDRLSTSWPAAVSALEGNAILPTTLNISHTEFGRLTAQLQTLQLPIKQLNLISNSFVNSPSLGLASQLIKQMHAFNASLAKIRWQSAQWNVQLPIQHLREISQSLEQAANISRWLATVTSISLPIQQINAISQSVQQINAIGGSLARVQQQMAQLKPFAVGYARICGSKRSGVYHRSICPYVQGIVIGNVISFSSAKEAKERGYSPCKLCRPP